MNNRGFEFSFGWIFAIFVGAVIIFLAIYSASNLVKQERKVTDSSLGKELGALISPLETSIESGKISRISFIDETRIYNMCEESGNFGEQGLAIASKSGIGKDWEKPGAVSRFRNKYVFSPEVIEGQGFVVFSKSVEMPFEIANVVYLIPENEYYCFVDPTTEINEEIDSLKPKNINLTSNIKECSKESVKVCFTNSGCDIDVNVNSQSVKKNRQNVFYEGNNALLYGAIFSDLKVYECQVKRIMKRASNLAEIYVKKDSYMEPRGCSSGLKVELQNYKSLTNSINNSLELREIGLISKEMDRRNKLLLCKLF